MTSTDGRKSSVKIVQIVTEQSNSLISARFFLDGTLDLLLFGVVSGGLWSTYVKCDYLQASNNLMLLDPNMFYNSCTKYADTIEKNIDITEEAKGMNLEMQW